MESANKVIERYYKLKKMEIKKDISLVTVLIGAIINYLTYHNNNNNKYLIILSICFGVIEIIALVVYIYFYKKYENCMIELDVAIGDMEEEKNSGCD